MLITALLLSWLVPAAGAQTLTLDPSTGSLRVLLYKDGPLRALGHDHVVRSSSFTGLVELSSASASLTFTVDAGALAIDEPQARAAEGMGALAEGDVRKITEGMRGPKGLDVERHPRIAFRSQSIEPVEGESDLWHVTGVFDLRGSTRTIDFPVAVSPGPGGRWFTGYVRLRPSDHGIKPFSVFAGAVRLKDEAFVRFTLLGK